MLQRISTALVYLAIFIPVLIIGSWVFDIFAFLIAAIIFSELISMKGISAGSFGAVTGYISLFFIVLRDRFVDIFPFLTSANVLILTMLVWLVYMLFTKLETTIEEIGLLLFGLFYIGNAFQTFVVIRDVEFLAIFYIMVVIWTTDTGAYLVGRKFGKNKLAPSISPNKTVEGAVGGVIVSLLASYLFILLFPVTRTIYPSFLIVILLSIGGQLGDLIESAIKRHYDIKDSGSMLPGHGGLFDRFDSLIFVLNIIKFLMDFGIFAY